MVNLEEIKRFLIEYSGPQIKLMEVCGTHTGSIIKNGIRSLLSAKIKLVSGPGCPVCVTPAKYIDTAVEFAVSKNHSVLSFGDLLRVPGTGLSLSEAKASGGNVEVIYSPEEVVEKALNNLKQNYILAAVGFETTIPTYALLMENLVKHSIANVKLLTSLKTIIPALDWLCTNEPDIDGFIAPGHVAAITGTKEYSYLADKYKKPFAVAGFEAEHVLVAIYDLVIQIIKGKSEVHNLYKSVVSEDGNVQARRIIDKYFEPATAFWRGIGKIPHSGLVIRSEYVDYSVKMPLEEEEISRKASGCRCGDVITGRIEPHECPLFGKLCTPSKPVGPCMVSQEGACGIHYLEY